MNKLRKAYNEARDNYAKAFCKKQELILEFEFDGGYAYWIGETILSVNDYYINLEDLMYDVDNNVKKGFFFEWYDYSLEQHYKEETVVNYKNYLMGI